jgi:hypothetical protein
MPLVFSEAQVVSFVARLVLGMSNGVFETTPPAVSGYLSGLNLSIAALSVAILSTLVLLLTIIFRYLMFFLIKLIRLVVRNSQKTEENRDLPPLELDEKYKGSEKEKFIFSKGFDPVDRD